MNTFWFQKCPWMTLRKHVIYLMLFADKVNTRASTHWNAVRPWACAWQVLSVEMQVTFVPHTLAQLDFASLEVPVLNK